MQRSGATRELGYRPRSPAEDAAAAVASTPVDARRALLDVGYEPLGMRDVSGAPAVPMWCSPSGAAVAEVVGVGPCTVVVRTWLDSGELLETRALPDLGPAGDRETEVLSARDLARWWPRSRVSRVSDQPARGLSICHGHGAPATLARHEVRFGALGGFVVVRRRSEAVALAREAERRRVRPPTDAARLWSASNLVCLAALSAQALLAAAGASPFLDPGLSAGILVAGFGSNGLLALVDGRGWELPAASTVIAGWMCSWAGALAVPSVGVLIVARYRQLAESELAQPLAGEAVDP
jgi:hypothetical protein